MRLAGIAVTLIGAAPVAGVPRGAEPAPRAATIAGIVQGSREGDVEVFRGIPYAAPPVGSLRWRTPHPVPRWPGVRVTTRFGHSCWQAVSPRGFGPWTHEYVVAGDISEDCLYLNVWSPARRRGSRPVLVWIHGGGFNSGSGAIPIYDGAGLAGRGAVVVTVNYRVGVFGFLAHPELSREAGGTYATNFGLLDIVAALHWVRANIARFGGDPNAVTIAGQSAGAMAVQQLVASHAATGLFRRAIGESGLPRALPTLTAAESDGLAFAREKGATSLAALRVMPAEVLQSGTGGNAVRFRPVADGRLLATGPWRPVNDVPMLVGLTADDNSAFGPDYGSSDPDRLRSIMEQRFGSEYDRLAALYPTGTARERAEASMQVLRDFDRARIDSWVRTRAVAAGTPAFGYVFDHVMPGPEAARWRAFHSSEIPYVFGTFAAAPERHFSARDRRVARLISSYWLNFISRGDPNGPGLPTWPALRARTPMIMRLDAAPRPQPLLPPGKLQVMRQLATK